jgi:hypothetical protein
MDVGRAEGGLNRSNDSQRSESCYIAGNDNRRMLDPVAEVFSAVFLLGFFDGIIAPKSARNLEYFSVFPRPIFWPEFFYRQSNLGAG